MSEAYSQVRGRIHEDWKYPESFGVDEEASGGRALE